MAYGYTDEYILTKTMEWLNDATVRIFEGKTEQLKLEAALHGAEMKEKPKEDAEAEPEKLEEVGISLGGR